MTVQQRLAKERTSCCRSATAIRPYRARSVHSRDEWSPGLMVDTLRNPGRGLRQQAEEAALVHFVRRVGADEGGCALARWKPVMAIGHHRRRGNGGLREANGVSAGTILAVLLAGPTPALLAGNVATARTARARLHGAVSGAVAQPRCCRRSAPEILANGLLMPGPDGPYDQLRRRGRPPRLAAVGGLHHRLCVDCAGRCPAGGRRGARRHRHATTTGFHQWSISR